MKAETFDRRTLFWGIFASVLAAAGFFLLSIYAPDFKLGREGGGMPLAKGATGFAGLVRLLELTGETTVMARTEADIDNAALMIVTITGDTDPAALKALVARRTYKATLFILPKWQTMPMPGHPGWEMEVGRIPRVAIDGWRKAIAGDAAVRPDAHGLERVTGRPHFLLADPDRLDNAGLRDPKRAEAALATIAALKPGDGPVMFDLTLHGGLRTHDLGKLLVEPPFLALTLTILATALLAVLHGLVRFGPPRAEGRAIAYGKRALVDTTAMLFCRAGRLGGLGPRYATLMRTRAGALLGAPPGLQGAALDQWLDARDREDARGFTDRLRAAEAAVGERAMHEAAMALHAWMDRRLSGR